MRIYRYTTKKDYITHVIIPALGEYTDDYDLAAIADDMLTRCTVIDPRSGLVHDNHSGFVERREVWFWDSVAKHELDQDDRDDDLPDGDVGDVYGTDSGVEIVTPGGHRWELSDQQARFLINTMTGLLARHK